MVAPDSEMRPVALVVVTVPPHGEVEELATVSPAGSVSIKATPVSATVLATGLVMVKVNEVVPFGAMFAGTKALAIDGGATTVSMAVLLVAPAPPLVEVTAPVVLYLVPAVVPVTFTLNVHVAPIAKVAPDRLITLVPAVSVMFPPPQLPVCPLGLEITRPAGSVSLKPIPVSVVVVLLFVMVKASEVEPFSAMLDVPNNLLIAGGPTTVTVAMLLVMPVPPSFEVMARVVLFWMPAVAPVTVTLNEHEPLAAMVALDRVMVPGEVVVSVPPPHVVEVPPATVSPAGSGSVNPTPVSPTVPLGFVMVKVSRVVLFSRMLDVPNPLVIIGGAATVRVAEAVLPVPPFVELTAPVVLFLTPAVVAVTATETTHELLAAIDPPLNVRVISPGEGENVPPLQVPIALGVLAT